MKLNLSITILLLITFSTFAQNQNHNYDSTLAKKLGADDYGMKSYVLVILKSGTNKISDKAMVDSLFKGHFANINRLAEEGKLIVAGPIGKNERSYRGIFILNTSSFDEANEMLIADPTIKEKVFDVELYNWYGSAALPVYLEASEKIWKVKP